MIRGRRCSRRTCPRLRGGWGKRCIAASLAAAFALACETPAEQPPESFPLVFRCTSEPGKPLAGVALSVGERLLGNCDGSGNLPASVDGEAGQRVHFQVSCPEGFAAPTDPIALTLRHLAPAAAPPELRVHCAPTRSALVVAVRAPGGTALPVLLGGRRVGRTNADGVAHVAVALPVGQRVRVRLDTSGQPDLIPPNPTRIYRAEARDELVVFDQVFSRKPKPRRRRRPRPARPTRI